jgi:large subunit ribosomal protein L20
LGNLNFGFPPVKIGGQVFRASIFGFRVYLKSKEQKMSRVKRGTIKKKKRRSILSKAKGFVAGRSKLYTVAKDAVRKSMVYAYRDRRTKKRSFRSLWIQRINAAARSHDMTYSQLIDGLAKADVEVNRKVLADMAVNDPASFASLAEIAKKNIAVNKEKST